MILSSVEPYAFIETQITDTIHQLGLQLPTDEKNTYKKELIELIANVTFVNKEKGIVKLDFNGNGNSRYHCFSQERGKSLQAIDQDVQKVVSQLSKEIVENLELKQYIFGNSPELVRRLFEKIKHPDESLIGMFSDCQLKDAYLVEKEVNCVLVFQDDDT